LLARSGSVPFQAGGGQGIQNRFGLIGFEMFYRKEGSDTAAIAILRTSGGAKAAVIGRQESQRRTGGSVTPIPGLCEAAFVLEVNPKKAKVVAAKGIWQVETEVSVAGKPDAPAAQKLAKVACSRLP